MFLTALRKVSDVFHAGAGLVHPENDGVGEHERRASLRHETEIAGRATTLGREQDCVIRNLSTNGMTVELEVSRLCVGIQILVSCEAVPALSGTVRWFRGNICGVEFVKPLSSDQVLKMRQVTAAGMQPRPGRARVKLPATARFANQNRQVEVLNLSVGGLMMRSALPPQPGQGLMIEFPQLMPLGAHVRWNNAGTCGVMFSKLLPVPVAEELACRARLPDAWLEEVRMIHRTGGGAWGAGTDDYTGRA